MQEIAQYPYFQITSAEYVKKIFFPGYIFNQLSIFRLSLLNCIVEFTLKLASMMKRASRLRIADHSICFSGFYSLSLHSLTGSSRALTCVIQYFLHPLAAN